MAQDANLVLQASVTKTSSFSGTGVSLPGGTPTRGLFAHVFYSAADDPGGTGTTVLFSIDVSPNAGSTWYAAEFSAVDQELTLTATAQAGEIIIPFNLNTPTIEGGTGPEVRLTCTITNGTGSPAPTVTYNGAIELGMN